MSAKKKASKMPRSSPSKETDYKPHGHQPVTSPAPTTPDSSASSTPTAAEGTKTTGSGTAPGAVTNPNYIPLEDARAREILAEHYKADAIAKRRPVRSMTVTCAAASWPRPAQLLISDGQVRPEFHEELAEWLGRVSCALNELGRVTRAYQTFEVFGNIHTFDDYGPENANQLFELMQAERNHAVFLLFAWLGGYQVNDLYSLAKFPAGTVPHFDQ